MEADSEEEEKGRREEKGEEEEEEKGRREEKGEEEGEGGGEKEYVLSGLNRKEGGYALAMMNWWSVGQ